jgi:RNA polymerase-binding transcription factor DksA
MSEADDLDRAAELTQRTNDAHVHRAMQKARPEQVQRADGTWPHPECVDCDAAIPLGRLKLGRIRCVHCQEAIERGRRGRAA